MIQFKSEAPLSDWVLNTWSESLGMEDLVAHGWTHEELILSADKYEYCYECSDAGLSSMVIYQQISRETLEVLFLATIPSQRRKGQMSQLLQELKGCLESQEIWLECREDNLFAIELYKKVGFKQSGRRPSYYRDGTAAILFNF